MNKYSTPAVILDRSINGIGVIRSLSQDPRVPIIVVSSPGASSGASRYVDEFIAVSTLEERTKALVGLNDQYEQVIVYPGSDKNYQWFLNNRDLLPNFAIQDDVLRDIEWLDKKPQMELAESLGIRCPWAISVTGLADFDAKKDQVKSYPIIAKPDNAARFRDENDNLIFKAVVANNEEEARALVARGDSAESDIILSQYVVGEEDNLITLGGYAYKGEIISPFCGYKIHHCASNKTAAIARTLDYPEAIVPSATFIKAINFSGLFQVEFKINDADGKLYYIEFNPRNWSWGGLAFASGNNLPLAKYYTETGQPEKWTPPNKVEGIEHYFVWELGVIDTVIGYRSLKPLTDWIRFLISPKTPVYHALFSFRDMKPFLFFMTEKIQGAVGSVFRKFRRKSGPAS